MLPFFLYLFNYCILEFGLTQNWFQKVVSRDHQIRLRRQNSIRSEQQIDIVTPVNINFNPTILIY